MLSTWQFFMGYRYAIFNYATQALGGEVTVSSFEVTDSLGRRLQLLGSRRRLRGEPLGLRLRLGRRGRRGDDKHAHRLRF
jgi:hypothetical protein